MRLICAFLLCAAISPVAFGQVFGFEGSTAGAMPATPDPEGWFSTGGVVTVVPFGAIAGPTSGAPTQGSKWCIVNAGITGNLASPAGGPAPYPLTGVTGNVSISIPLPAGATSIEFDWNYVSPECQNDAQYNDFLSIDLTNGAGVVLQPLLYRDTFSTQLGAPAVTPNEGGIVTGGFCNPPGTLEEMALGTMKTASIALTISLPATVTFEVNVGNGFDTAFSSYAYLDNVKVIVTPTVPTMILSQPTGAGSLTVTDIGLTAGLETWNAFSISPCVNGPGTGPYGGLCANNQAELDFILNQVFSPLSPANLFHYPATGTVHVFGPVSGIPSALTVEGVCFQLNGATLVFGPVVNLTTL